jgi:hypothetical protein
VSRAAQRVAADVRAAGAASVHLNRLVTPLTTLLAKSTATCHSESEHRIDSHGAPTITTGAAADTDDTDMTGTEGGVIVSAAGYMAVASCCKELETATRLRLHTAHMAWAGLIHASGSAAAARIRAETERELAAVLKGAAVLRIAGSAGSGAGDRPQATHHGTPLASSTADLSHLLLLRTARRLQRKLARMDAQACSVLAGLPWSDELQPSATTDSTMPGSCLRATAEGSRGSTAQLLGAPVSTSCAGVGERREAPDVAAWGGHTLHTARHDHKVQLFTGAGPASRERRGAGEEGGACAGIVEAVARASESATARIGWLSETWLGDALAAAQCHHELVPLCLDLLGMVGGHVRSHGWKVARLPCDCSAHTEQLYCHNSYQSTMLRLACMQ